MYTCLPPNTDPFFFDGEDLREIADEQIIKAGLTLFKDHQVIECYQDNDLLCGKVADEEWDWPAEVQLQLAMLCDRAFQADGTFSGRLPDDFFRFIERVEERGDIHLGETGAPRSRPWSRR